MNNHTEDTQQDVATTTSTKLSRTQKRRKRRERRFRQLCEENEMLHRRLAAIYDALTL